MDNCVWCGRHLLSTHLTEASALCDFFCFVVPYIFFCLPTYLFIALCRRRFCRYGVGLSRRSCFDMYGDAAGCSTFSKLLHVNIKWCSTFCWLSLQLFKLLRINLQHCNGFHKAKEKRTVKVSRERNVDGGNIRLILHTLTGAVTHVIKPLCGAGAPLFPPCPFTSSSFPLFTFSFLSLALPILFFCPSLPFLPE